MPKEQRFEIGYHLNTWDFEGRPEEGFPVLAEVGFKWYEALIFNTLSEYFERRFLTLDDMGPLDLVTDTDLLRRLQLFNKAQEEYGLQLASLYANAEYTNRGIVALRKRDCILAIARFLQGFGVGDPGSVEAGRRSPPSPRPNDDFRAFARRVGRAGDLHQQDRHPHRLPSASRLLHRRPANSLTASWPSSNTELVGLCIDPAHLVIKDTDPVDIMRAYMELHRLSSL